MQNRLGLKENKIPASCQSSTTILIPKCNDPKVARDYRPIALTQTVYRLFAVLLSRRLYLVGEGVCSHIITKGVYAT